MKTRKVTFFGGKKILFFIAFLFLSGGYGIAAEPVVTWGAGQPKAEPINIGSGKPGYIEFRFEVEDAAIPGAKIEIQFPSSGFDVYDNVTGAQKGVGAYVDYTGHIAWSATDKKLTFSGKDLAVGNNIWYKVPHKAIDAISLAQPTGSVRIRVLKSDDTVLTDTTIAYNYNRAQVLIVPASGQTSLSLNFGTNDGAHNPGTNTAIPYKFGVKTTGGDIDSCRITYTFDKTRATIMPGTWKCNNVAVTRVAENVGSTNVVYTLYLDKSHSLGGDGFDNNEVVDITVDVKKTFCGTDPVEIQGFWGSSGNYITSTANNGSFAATPALGTPVLERVSFGPSAGATLLYMDGYSNEYEAVVKNSSTTGGEAYDIVYNMRHDAGAFASFIDASSIQCQVEGGSWEAPLSVSVNSRTSNTSPIKTIYRNQPLNVTIKVKQPLPAGKKLTIKWGSVIPPGIRDIASGSEYLWYRSLRSHDNWAYTDLCRTLTGTLASYQVHTLPDFIYVTKYSTSAVVKGGEGAKEIKTASITPSALGSAYLRSGSSAYFALTVELPGGIRLNNSGVNAAKLGTTNLALIGSATENSSSNTYTFKIPQSLGGGAKDLYLTYIANCPATDGTYQAEIKIDYYPTGTVAGSPPTKDVLMTPMIQFYMPVSLVCATVTDGVTYDLKMTRQSLGLEDVGNKGLPDPSRKRIDLTTYTKASEIDHTQMLYGDTMVLNFNGTVKGTNCKTLYAVIYTNAAKPDLSFLQVAAPSGLTVTPVYGVSSGILNLKTISPPFAPGLDKAYVLKIERNTQTNFTHNQSIDLNVKYKALGNIGGYDATQYKFVTWLYGTSLATETDPLAPTDRKGTEEYTAAVSRYGGGFSGWPTGGNMSYTFTGPQTIEYGVGSNFNFYYNPLYLSGLPAFSPYEYRHIVTTKTVRIKVPEGYVLGNQLKMTVTSNPSIVYVANASGGTKTEKTYDLTPLYDDSYSNPSPANKFRFADGFHSFTFYPHITSTPRLQPGTSGNCEIFAVTDISSYTQANVVYPSQNAGTTRFTYCAFNYADAGGIKLSSDESASKPMNATSMSWNLKVSNTTSSVARKVWLYVQGPVKNVKYNNVNGTGEENRWILIDNIGANATISGNITFDVKGDLGCAANNITIYPIFDPANAGTDWHPFGAENDISFNPSHLSYDKYVYPEKVFTLTSVNSMISGHFTSWANSIIDPTAVIPQAYGLDSVEVTCGFPVELVFDASSSSAPVAKLKVDVSFPKGLEYVDDSTFISYNGTIWKVPSSSNIVTALQTLDGTSPINLTLKLEDAGMAQLHLDTAVINAGERVKLHFRLRPTCNISMTGDEIKAKFSGVRFCNFTDDVINNLVYASTKLNLRNTVLPYRSLLTFDAGRDSLICESVLDSTEMTLSFRKQTKLGEALTASDSIKILLPVSLDLYGDIHYSFPAYGSLVTAEEGTVPWSQVDTYVEDTIRYLSWQLPLSYYDKLYPTAESDKVKISYKWKVKTVKAGLQQIDSAKIYMATRAAAAPHMTCPYTILDADSIIHKVILVPAKIVTIPKGTGYVITDKYGKEITATDTVIYSGGEFKFNVKLLYGYTKSIPTVKANGLQLAIDGQGQYYFTYKFNVLVDTHLTVDDVELNKYTVSFDTQGGSKVNPYTGVVHGSTISKPSTRPVHAEYKFRGWYTCNDTAYIEPWAFDITPVVNDTTIYVFWVEVPIPIINRSVKIPFVEGVMSYPDSGVYYVRSGEDYTFSLGFSMLYPLKVTTGRFIDDKYEEIFGTKNSNGQYEYVIRQVRSNILLSIGPDAASENSTSNELIDGALVWSHNDKLYVTLEKEDIIHIYSITGSLVKRIESGAGTVTIPLDRGVYIITLPNANQTKKVLIQR